MTISVIAKSQDTFEVVVATQSTTTHSVTVTDAIHTKLTNGKISKETLVEKSFEFLLLYLGKAYGLSRKDSESL